MGQTHTKAALSSCRNAVSVSKTKDCSGTLAGTKVTVKKACGPGRNASSGTCSKTAVRHRSVQNRITLLVIRVIFLFNEIEYNNSGKGKSKRVLQSGSPAIFTLF